MLVGLGVWAVYTFRQQAQALGAFTSPDPQTLPVRITTGPEVQALRDKFNAFKSLVDRGEAASLVVTHDELNILLSGFESLADIKPLFVVRELKPDGKFVAQVSFPLNTLPGQHRYLNGEIDGVIGAHHESGLYIAAQDVRVPGKTVPMGFKDVYQRGVIPGKSFGFLDDMLLRNFRADPAVSATLRHIRRVSSTTEQLTLSTKAQTKETGDDASLPANDENR